MRFVKRYWAPLLAAGLIPLLIVLAFFQLTWISEMGERERFRLTQGLYAAAGQLSTAFENEIGVLPAVFRQGRDDLEKSMQSGDWTNFKKRWEVWKTYALDPSFVAGFHIVRTYPNGRPAEVRSWDGNTFAADSDQALVKALGDAVGSVEGGRLFPAPMDLTDGTEVFLLPGDWHGNYWLAIRLDRKALTERLIPMLAERYLFGKNDYVFRIVDTKDRKTVFLSVPKTDERIFEHSDVSIALVRADFRGMHAEDGPPPLKNIEAEPGFAIMKARRDAIDKKEDLDQKIGGRRLPPPRMENGRENARWTLEAVHRSGSLAQAIRAEILRSSIVSMGILLILGVVLVIFADAVRRTQELADRRREFIATVTHELKTPIAVIRSAAENLADGVVKDLEKTTKYGNVIRRESGKLTDMIDSLLVYARVGDGVPRQHEAVDVGSLALRALESRQDDLIAANFTVDSDISEGVYVKGDGSALELAVGNLISNAIKHAAEGAFLGITVAKDKNSGSDEKAPNGWCVLSVSDRGPGIARKERKLVFDPFYRGEIARRRQTPGSGLGLNLVARIVEAHGGTVTLDTQVERGSTFVIRLPLEENSHA